MGQGGRLWEFPQVVFLGCLSSLFIPWTLSKSYLVLPNNKCGFYTRCDDVSFLLESVSACHSAGDLRWKRLVRSIPVGLTASCCDHAYAAGTSRTSCGRFPRMQGCPSRASLASANMRKGPTVWSPCSGISRTPTQGCSSLSSSCLGRRQCMVQFSWSSDYNDRTLLRVAPWKIIGMTQCGFLTLAEAGPCCRWSLLSVSPRGEMST